MLSKPIFMTGKFVKIIIASLAVIVIALTFFARAHKKASAFSGFTGVAGAILAVPVNVVGDIPFSIKEQVEDTIVRALARNAQTRLQNGVLDKIRKGGIDQLTGNSGSPAFVQDWRQFLQGGQYRGEDVFRAMLADATLGSTICQYMRSSLANIFNVKSKVPNFDSNKYRVDSLQPFILQNKCSPELSGFNIETFRNDFNAGGWDAWGKLIQPQNNFYGVFGNSLNELTKQRGLEETTNRNEAVAGGGFTSKRSNCQGTSSGLSCVVLGQIQTPAQILGTTVQRSIDEDFSWITSADEFSELLAGIANALFDSLLSKIDNLSGGIAGGTGTQVFNAAGCIADCINAGNKACVLNEAACAGLNDPELSDCIQREQDKFKACKDDVTNSCREICAANIIP